MVTSVPNNKILRILFRSFSFLCYLIELSHLGEDRSTDTSQLGISLIGTYYFSQERNGIFSSFLVLLVTLLHSKSVICLQLCECLCASSWILKNCRCMCIFEKGMPIIPLWVKWSFKYPSNTSFFLMGRLSAAWEYFFTQTRHRYSIDSS